MTDRDRIDPVRGPDPVYDNPNAPHRNPDQMHPAPPPHEVDQRPVESRPRGSSATWLWILVVGVALIAIFSFFTIGGPDDVTTTGTVPQQEAPAVVPADPTAPGPATPAPPPDPATPVQPARPVQ